MKRHPSFRFIAATLALTGLLLAACSSGAAPTPIGDASKGKDKYATTCVSCHGPDAKGMPGLGKDLTTSEFAKSLSDTDLVAFVLKGRSTSDPANTTGVDMPPKGGNPALTEDDIKDIVSYLRTLEK